MWVKGRGRERRWLDGMEKEAQDAGRVLVVDDQPGVRRLMVEIAKIEGFNADTASSGQEALHLIQHNRYSLIFLDLKMPGISGLEIIPYIRELQPGVPIVVMTAYGEQQIAKEVIQAGAIARLDKPFDVVKVKELLQQLVGQDEHKRIKVRDNP